MEQKEFKKEKLSSQTVISKELFKNFKLDIAETPMDFITDTLTANLSGYLYTSMVEERDLIYYTKRPTFLDWLLRRRERVVFKLEVKDLLLDPPDIEGTVRLYNITNQLDNLYKND